MVDGRELTRDRDYTASAGSVAIALLPDYLGTLSAGQHTMTVRFSDADEVRTVFSVEREKPVVPQHNPSTGLAGHIWLYAGILVAAAAAAAVFMVMRRKKNGE